MQDSSSSRRRLLEPCMGLIWVASLFYLHSSFTSVGCIHWTVLTELPMWFDPCWNWRLSKVYFFLLHVFVLWVFRVGDCSGSVIGRSDTVRKSLSPCWPAY